MPCEQTNMKVVVRVRPYNGKELEQQHQRCIIKVMDSSSLLFDPDEEPDEFFFQGSKQQYRDITKKINKKLAMDFDRVYDTQNSNEDIFLECTSPLVDSVLNGYNCSVFVYGATGAGKTFTMLGSESCPGLTFLTMADLFAKIQSQQGERKFDVGVSYLEVYNEHVMNLLTKTGPLKLREDANGVVVSGLALTPIYSAEELLRLLALGNANRTQHPTDANAESSRSHAIFQVHIRMTDRLTGTKRSVKLSMIDLAGSERAASTKGMGVRFKEGASINKSLLALGNCINKLADGLKHIPYRDSNLTRILKDSLGGNCRTLMVANVSMSSLTYEDTYNTLKYASRAKKIRSTLRQNVLKSNMPKEFYVKKVNEVMAENERLKERNRQLETKLQQLDRPAAGASEASAGYNALELQPWFNKIDAVYELVMRTQEHVIGLKSKSRNLDYRQTLKQNFEEFRRRLALRNREYEEDFIRFSKHMAVLNKQYAKYKEERPYWRKKLEDALAELDALKVDVLESKFSDVLSIYLAKKDLELELSKQTITSKHVNATNFELVDNTDIVSKSFTAACEILHQIYDSLDSALKMTPEIQILYESLLRRVRFSESEMTASLASLEAGENSPRKRRRSQGEEEDSEPNQGIKRLCGGQEMRPKVPITLSLNLGADLEDSDTEDVAGADCNTTHVIRKAARNLNETQVLGRAPLSATVTKSRAPCHSQIVSDLLSGQNVRSASDKEKIKQALLKSNKFSTAGLQRTLAAAALQKENLKFGGNCVRKSPRALMAKTLSGTALSMRKQTARLAGTLGSGAGGGGGGGGGVREAPLVRTNRAASFRVKK